MFKKINKNPIFINKILYNLRKIKYYNYNKTTYFIKSYLKLLKN